MKSKELHQLISKNGWQILRVKGSHYIYEKDGRTYPVPYYGAKEVGKGIELKIKKEMNLQ
jgi:mRNA interferase HicA